MNRQLNLFDLTYEAKNLDAISSCLDCDDKGVLVALSKAIDNFCRLPRKQKYVLSFSGGKDSHIVLGAYLLYLKLGNPPLKITVMFADTGLEVESLYCTIALAQKFCQRNSLSFQTVQSDRSYWFVQFALGYPVPNHFARWCTGKLKVQPMQPSKKLKAITGRHYGESVARDKRLSCGTSSCGDNNFKDSYDPIAHFTNCLVWDTLFYLDTTVLYGGVFDHLQQQYEIAVDSKTGSLRMGCFMCPVVAVSTLRQNVQSGILDERGFQVRELLEDLRTARRIKNQRTQKNGAIYIEDRRKYWKLLDKEYLLMNNYITTKDIAEISDRLSSDYAYPPTYKRKWIDKQHRLIK